MTRLIAMAAAASATIFMTALTAPAHAVTTTGIAVDAIGSSSKVGNYSGDDIQFFITLFGTETYGVGGGGMSADTCSHNCSGTLYMNILYDPVTSGPNVVDMFFNDLDLPGVNDPAGFLESLTFYSYDPVTLALVQIPYVIDSANSSTQHLSIGVASASNPYWAQLVFTANMASTFNCNGYCPTWQNTVETLRTTITPSQVPLPAALPLLGTALAGLGLIRRRRRKAVVETATESRN